MATTVDFPSPVARRSRPAVASLAAVLLTAACGTTGIASSAGPRGAHAITAVATISVWGSVLAQLGGSHVQQLSIISNPDTDPHDYEPTTADARSFAVAQLVVENGVGYDSWADKLLAANPTRGRAVVNVGKLVGVPAGGNPHRWYSPADVESVAAAITADLKRLDPAEATYFDQRHQAFLTTGLATYRRLVDEIKQKYVGVPVGASEGIVTPLANALGLRLLTPPGFLLAISEGSDPSAADKAAIDAQIAQHAIKVYLFNRQNSTPDVAAQVHAARAQGIPVASITETLWPATASFQDWQVSQLRAIQSALRQGTGR